MAKKRGKDPKRAGVRAVRVRFPDADGLPQTGEPGEFELWGTDHMFLACPGCGWVSGMRVGNPKPALSPSWHMTGPPDAPSLTPSLNCTGCCGWHGYLTDGVFNPC